MADNEHSANLDLIKRQLEEGARRAALEEEGRGPLYDKDRKFLGIIPASSQAIRGLIYGAWLASVESVSGKFIPALDRLLQPTANKIFSKNATRAAAASKLSAAGITIGIAAAPFIGDIFSGTKKQKNKREITARKLRALLEDVTGKSGVDAMMHIGENQNEALYVQRKRYEAEMQQGFKDDLVMMSLSTAPTAVMSISKSINFKELIGKVASGGNERSGLGIPLGGAGIAGLAPQIGEWVNEDSKRRYKLNRQPYTALEMIINLDEQMRDIDFSNGSGVDSFKLPEKGGSKSLAGYIAETFKQHQYDMQKINPEHSTLRSALHSKLEDISKDIAEAMKRGDIAPMSLARLVGEGAVIKNRGRSLAKLSDVRTTLQKMSKSALNYLQVDSLEYYGESSFSRRDLKEALGSLDNDDKIIFASLVPDDILKEAGMKGEQIQKIRNISAEVYEKKLAQIVTGLAGYDDQALSDLGLAEEEISQLRDVARHVKSKGEESIKEFRAKPTDPAGIERVVTNAVVNRVQGNKEYLGNLIRQGQEFIDAAPLGNSELVDVEENQASELQDEALETTNDADAAIEESAEETEIQEEKTRSFASKEELRRDALSEDELDVAI